MTENETPDTINVELPIEARGDYVRIVGLTNLSRDYWRALAADPSTALLEVNAHIAPAVVAWIERDEWKPLDLPAEGRTIKATLRYGRVETFKVREIEDAPAWACVWKADSDDAARYIQRTPDVDDPSPIDIIAWEYVDEPEEVTITLNPEQIKHMRLAIETFNEVWPRRIRAAGLTVAGESDD